MMMSTYALLLLFLCCKKFCFTNDIKFDEHKATISCFVTSVNYFVTSINCFMSYERLFKQRSHSPNEFEVNGRWIHRIFAHILHKHFVGFQFVLKAFCHTLVLKMNKDLVHFLLVGNCYLTTNVCVIADRIDVDKNADVLI